MNNNQKPNYILALLLGTAMAFTAIGTAFANDRSASFLTISTEQFLPDHMDGNEDALGETAPPGPIKETENEKQVRTNKKAEVEVEAEAETESEIATATEPPAIVVTLPARTKEKTTGSDLLAACRDKMFTDRGTGYCLNKKLEKEKSTLQKTDRIAYTAIRHNENPSVFRKKRRDLATENLTHRLKMETDCYSRKQDRDEAFEKEMADMTCRIDHIEKYREQLSTRYLDYYEDKNNAPE